MRALGCSGHSQLALQRSSITGMHFQELGSEGKQFLRCEAAGTSGVEEGAWLVFLAS
jgi:hypothetical protein